MKGGKKTLEKGRKIEVIFYFLFVYFFNHSLIFFWFGNYYITKSKAAILAETVLCWIDNWQKKKQGNEEKEVK